MRTVQYSGVPGHAAEGQVEAGVVALKSRTIAAADAVAQSLAALAWLRKQGCTQFFFKYCSTFDSTPDGNIGPVADALADALQATRVIVCPAYPSLKRSIYEGHLFVGDKLLSESGMEKHPLTPMTDPDLRRWLARQSRSKVGHVAAPIVQMGREAIRAALDAADGRGERLIVVDTIKDSDLVEIGAAAADLPLITGGSGIALGLPDNFRARGAIGGSAIAWDGSDGPAAVLSGSCSTATRGQVARHRTGHPALEVLADAVMDGSLTPAVAATWAQERQDSQPLVYSSADPEVVRAAQEQIRPRSHRRPHRGLLGRNGAPARRRRLHAHRVGRRRNLGRGRRGAGCRAPWPSGRRSISACRRSRSSAAISSLALKSGNFGAPDFFATRLGRAGRQMSDDAALREAICRFARSIFDRGLTAGASGNISARTADGGLLVTPTGSSFGALDPARLSRFDATGRLTGGDQPTKEMALHTAFYDTRGARAGAVVHLHSTHSVALSMLPDIDPDCVLPPLTAYSVMRLGKVKLLPYFRPGDAAMGEAVRGLAGKRSAVLLANHGPVVAAKDLEAAVYAMEELEETAKLALLTRGMKPNMLSEAQVRDVVDHFDVEWD